MSKDVVSVVRSVLIDQFMDRVYVRRGLEEVIACLWDEAPQVNSRSLHEDYVEARERERRALNRLLRDNSTERGG